MRKKPPLARRRKARQLILQALYQWLLTGSELTDISKQANKGVSVRVVQTLAGHSSMQTTQRYIDVNEGKLVQAVELI